MEPAADQEVVHEVDGHLLLDPLRERDAEQTVVGAGPDVGAQVRRRPASKEPIASVEEAFRQLSLRSGDIGPDPARTLLKSIDVSNPVGLRDRAVLAVLIYTAARVGAVAKLTMKSLKHDGTQYALRFSEKGGKSREIPVRHDLEQFLLDYIRAAGIAEGPLFRTANRRTKTLTTNAMTGIDICRMMKRRLKAAGLPGHFSPHSFRVTTVTDLLEQNVPLEDVQYLAGHADPRTTRIYDRGGARSRGTSSNGSRSDSLFLPLQMCVFPLLS